MGVVVGVLYCLLWYSSIFAGYAGLFCPIFPVLLVSNKLYRYLTDVLFTFWQCYPTVLLKVLCSCDIQISGAPVQAGETALVIMNHRTRTDWNYVWPMAFHCIVGGGRCSQPIKFVLKDVIRHIPGPGWVMQLACCVYIKRYWQVDQRIFKKTVDYFNEIKYKFTLLVFPEGTDLTSTTKGNSDRYAETHQLDKYNYVLHPRTTGFAYLASELIKRKNLDAVYDVTLLYPDVIPQSEKELIFGLFPKQVKMHLARYPSSTLPTTQEGLKSFLESLWRDKERTLREHAVTGAFPNAPSIRRPDDRILNFALVFWTLLPAFVAYAFYQWRTFRVLVLAHSLLLVCINLFGEGFMGFEIGVMRARTSLGL